MGIKETLKTIKKSLIISIRFSYQSIYNHPVPIIFSIFLFFMYKYFPCLFSFLLSTSPVLICTTLLLGILLSFGQPNFPQIEEENHIKYEIHTRNLPQIEKKNPQIEPTQIQIPPIQNEPNITERDLNGLFFNQEEKDDKTLEKTDILQRETPLERETTLERETSLERETILERETPLKRETTLERETTTTIQRGESSSSSSFMRAFSLNEISLEDQIDLGSPKWQRIDGQDRSSDSESDGGESSSPDASMTDIIPLLEEIDPLLDRNTLLNNTTQNHKTDSDSHDEEEEEEEEEEEREIEGERKGDELTEPAFSWTADDQKNLMDLGYSEMERNQRLENLMARRRSRKNIVFDPQNLIDLDSSSPHRTGLSTGTDELSRFRVQVAPVSVPRSNPFDFDPDPVPGSAPSVFNPRRNPFDFTPYEQPNEKNIFPKETSSFSPREFMNVSHQNMFFKKYDSFNYSSERERRFSRMKPYFVPEFGMDGIRTTSNSNHNNNNNDDAFNNDDEEEEELGGGKEEERESGTESETDDGNSVDVELDQTEFGERESPSLAFDFLHSLEDEIPFQRPVPDLLSWDNQPVEVSLGGASSALSHSTELEENYENSPQFRTMDLHSIPEEEPTEAPKPDSLNPKPSDPDSDDDAERIFPEPMEETFLSELDQVGDFNVLGFQNTVPDAIRVSDANRVSNGEDPEFTVYNARRQLHLEASENDEIDSMFSGSLNRDLDSRILGESSNEGIGNPDINLRSFDDIESALEQASESEDMGLIGETKSGILIMKANSKAGLELVFKQMGEFLGKSEPGNENPGFVEDFCSGMMVLDAKCINDIDSAFEGIENTGNGDSGLVDETESGMLIMKAKSKEDMELVFKQVGEVLGKSNPGNGNSESGMMVLEAKSINDIDLALFNATENEGNGDNGLIDETDSGLLIMKAKSKEEIESVFKQVSEVLGKSNAGNENPGFVDESGILVLNATSIEDIDSAILQVSQNTESENTGLIDETDSGMLIMKAKSKEEIESVFKQVREVLGKQDPGNENPEFSEDSDSGMLVLDAKSINDIDSALFNMSQDQENEFHETENGMLILKANSVSEMDSVFKQVSGVLGKQNPANESPGIADDSGMSVLDAKSINDIDSALYHMSEKDQENEFNETENGMLILKAKSVSEMESVFKQVGEVLGKQNPGNENPGIVGDSEMMVLDAKSINDIDSALYNMSEDKENEFNETENGMLILKAKSVSEMESVFKQVGEVLGNQNPGNENPGFQNTSNSEMLVLDAKSINDIDSAIYHASENTETGIEEMDNGMLVMKANSLENMESVFKQVGEVLGENSNTGFQNPGFSEKTESEMLVVKAKSIEDIDLAIKQASEIKETN